ncbi:MAG: hypothetical protein BroJett030_03360 [Alphaproteobacteria bacterium]|nr:MAG: hypothetical protein BroJett030_03360 [Alphaproteobacteria bacterium]
MKLITANRLFDGAVVFLAAEGWVADIARAAVLNAADAIEAGLAAATRAVADRHVVDVNVIEVTLDAAGLPVPVRLRERIRAFGPTVPFGEAARERLAA